MNPKIEKAFTCHSLSEKEREVCEALRVEGKSYAYMIDVLVPNSREKSLALTKLEECVMWANAGIARNGVEG